MGGVVLTPGVGWQPLWIWDYKVRGLVVTVSMEEMVQKQYTHSLLFAEVRNTLLARGTVGFEATDSIYTS